jgi:hypothetical protein
MVLMAGSLGDGGRCERADESAMTVSSDGDEIDPDRGQIMHNRDGRETEVRQT